MHVQPVRIWHVYTLSIDGRRQQQERQQQQVSAPKIATSTSDHWLAGPRELGLHQNTNRVCTGLTPAGGGAGARVRPAEAHSGRCGYQVCMCICDLYCWGDEQ